MPCDTRLGAFALRYLTPLSMCCENHRLMSIIATAATIIDTVGRFPRMVRLSPQVSR
jgi:hypothetical protein